MEAAVAMHKRFSAPTGDALRKAGWFPGRSVEAAAGWIESLTTDQGFAQDGFIVGEQSIAESGELVCALET